jgi:hypothetical protein
VGTTVNLDEPRTNLERTSTNLEEAGNCAVMCGFSQLGWHRRERPWLNEFMTTHVYVSSEEVQWEFAAGHARTIEKIRSEIVAAFACNRVVLDGAGPMFVNNSGQTLFIGNIVRECLRHSRRDWSRLVRTFVSNMMLMINVEDPLALSVEVVCASLRLRLFEDDNVNGWVVEGASSAFGDEILQQVLTRPAMPGAKWALYLERPGSGQGVVREHLDRWGLEPEQAFEFARRNSVRPRCGQHYKRYGVFRESGDSMFTHNRVLYPELLIADAPDGWIVSAPTRNDVLVTQATMDTRGPNRFAQLLKEARTLWSTAAYPTSRHCWYVPPEGMGPFGEHAEAIVLADESLDGVI